MVALSPEFFPALVEPGRIAFVAVNGQFDCVVLEGAAEDEYRQRVREGWRVVEVRPICRSLRPRLTHLSPELHHARAWSYSLVILEHPTTTMVLRPTSEVPSTPSPTQASDRMRQR